MLNEIWGVTNRPGLDWPGGLPGIGLLVLAFGLLAWAWRRGGGFRAWRAMTRPQWAIWVALSGASLLLSQLFPLSIPWSNPLLRASPLTGAVVLLSAVPYLLAGLALPVPAAIVVGLLAGLGRALGQTGQPLDVIAVGLAAGLSAALMKQSYTGRLSSALRRPGVAGAIGRLVVVAAAVLGLLATAWPTAGFFGALDLALFFGLWSLVPLLIEGVVGGLLASVVLWVAPQWRPEVGRVPSPWQRSLQRQLAAAFLTFAAAVVLLSALVAFYFSARATERALVEQMMGDVTAIAARLEALETELEAVATTIDDSAGTDAARSALGRLGPSTAFSDVRLMRPSGEMIAGPAAGLTPAVQAAAAEALRAGETRWASATENGQQAVALAAPGTAEGQPVVVLARVAPAALEGMLDSAGASGDQQEGLIVDERGLVVAARGAAAAGQWAAPTTEEVLGRVTRATGHTVYATTDPTTGARQLLVYVPVRGNGWKVVAAVPNAAILRTTLGIIGPLAALLLAVTGLFYALVASLGRGISRPIAEMGQASRAIAGGGGLERPVRPQREDEIGQLSLAFSQMQRALRQRLDELSLLLSVSNEVAATIHIDEGMAAVLQGVLRGTGGAGARAIVRNPQAPAPLVFAQGPAAESVAALDRAVLLSLRNREQLAYGSAAEIEEGLGVIPSPAAALFALPLRPGGEFQGALYVTYRQPHYFDRDERGLLQTLAGQATVLVQNAHLFAAAESGRRRLAAVLASASNAIIVTDPTDRVLFVNPAMERAFGLSSRDVAGRPVGDALAGVEMPVAPARRLSPGLTAGPADSKLEVEANGRSFLAAIATVASREGQTMGRVAVLQDVTELKEVERLKSEFLAGVSHDLLSPLTYMHNYAAMLPIIDDPALEREAAEKILVGIERLKTMVNDLLDMARIEAGLNLQFDRVDVGELLAEVAQEYASPARAAGLRPVVESPPELPPVLADPTLLRRAVTNLVTNALKYAPQSGPLRLRAEATAGEIILSVRDHGPGIAAADRAHLFEKFYRGGETMTAGRPRGSGLGLAIVKSVADLHGGRAWCESEPGQGSAFFLALPRGRE